MKLIMIPETEAEKARKTQMEFCGVRDFLMFGVKADEDEQYIDFHEWQGNLRYLLGSLMYYYEVINDERRKMVDGPNVQKMPPHPFHLVGKPSNAPSEEAKPIDFMEDRDIVLPDAGYELDGTDEQEE